MNNVTICAKCKHADYINIFRSRMILNCNKNPIENFDFVTGEKRFIKEVCWAKNKNGDCKDYELALPKKSRLKMINCWLRGEHQFDAIKVENDVYTKIVDADPNYCLNCGTKSKTDRGKSMIEKVKKRKN